MNSRLLLACFLVLGSLSSVVAQNCQVSCNVDGTEMGYHMRGGSAQCQQVTHDGNSCATKFSGSLNVTGDLVVNGNALVVDGNGNEKLKVTEERTRSTRVVGQLYFYQAGAQHYAIVPATMTLGAAHAQMHWHDTNSIAGSWSGGKVENDTWIKNNPVLQLFDPNDPASADVHYWETPPGYSAVWHVTGSLNISSYEPGTTPWLEVMMTDRSGRAVWSGGLDVVNSVHLRKSWSGTIPTCLPPSTRLYYTLGIAGGVTKGWVGISRATMVVQEFSPC